MAAAAAAIAAATPATPAANTTGPTDDSWISGVNVVGLAIGILVAPFLAKRFKGMSAGEVVATIFEWISHGVGFGIELISKLVKMLGGKKAIPLPDK